ncbi:MAG: ECF-type sigma factor [Planctomycetota bacterium JB042]
MIDPERSVTQWIRALKGGDDDAASRIWERFFGRVVLLARKRLGDLPRGARDEEDFALSAMNALCEGARHDRFRKLEDRGDLWSLLAMITIRKVIDARRRDGRRGEVSVAEAEVELDRLAAGEPIDGAGTATYVDGLCVTSREMLESLDDRVRDVALLRLEGHSNEEIAARTGRSISTVERHLRMVRHSWRGES